MTEAEKAYQYFVIAVPENEEQAKAYFWARQVLQLTLNPPNETPPCYQPDGDGCAYQCYDGDDEPIDKCKECPLCYSDKQRHHTPPNEWVSVEDAVPDPGVRVLAANGNFVGEAYMASNGAWMRHDGFPWEVDAWMPMPDRCPPEGEEDT